jgi:hypothetical protein
MTPSESFTDIFPKISLVTPVFNSARYLEQTICSVLEQHYPNIEYLIIDGGSTDGTLDIIHRYESHLSGWISEPDNGMYDALNKGFAHTTGEIMGWISATDKLNPGGLAVVGGVFSQFSQVEWITGRRTVFTQDGRIARTDPLMCWSRYSFLLAGSQRHIQQESTYWRRSLWERAGGSVDGGRRWAGDFELWVRFFRHAQLYTVDACIGGFREHSDSASLGNITTFNRLCDQIAETELRKQIGSLLDAYKWFDSTMGRMPMVRAAWDFGKAHALRAIYSLPGPVIRRMDRDWKIRLACGYA